MDPLITQSASLTEPNESGKVLDPAGAIPVAIPDSHSVVADLVPADPVIILSHAKAPDADVKAVLASRRKAIAPVLDYLQDK